MWKAENATIITAAQKAERARSNKLAEYKAAFDQHLDAVAQQRQYDSRLTVAAYVNSTIPQWSAEASAFVAWRDAGLMQMFATLADVEAGTIEPPTIENFIAGMPAMVWPEVWGFRPARSRRNPHLTIWRYPKWI